MKVALGARLFAPETVRFDSAGCGHLSSQCVRPHRGAPRMPFVVTCPTCHGQMSVVESPTPYAVACPACSHPLTVPATTSSGDDREDDFVPVRRPRPGTSPVVPVTLCLLFVGLVGVIIWLAVRPTPQVVKAEPDKANRPPNQVESADTPRQVAEWNDVVSTARKRAAIISDRGEAERLSVQAELASRAAQTLGEVPAAERPLHVEALKRVKEVGIARSDELSIQRAELIAPVTVSLLRSGAAQSKAGRELVELAATKLASTPVRGDSGYTADQLRRLPGVKLTLVGVNMELFTRASAPLASDYVLLQNVGLNQLALAKAVENGMSIGAAPGWYLNRKRSGLTVSIDQEAELLVRVWATAALLLPADRPAFAQRLEAIAAKPDFGAIQIGVAAAR